MVTASLNGRFLRGGRAAGEGQEDVIEVRGVHRQHADLGTCRTRRSIA